MARPLLLSLLRLGSDWPACPPCRGWAVMGVRDLLGLRTRVGPQERGTIMQLVRETERKPQPRKPKRDADPARWPVTHRMAGAVQIVRMVPGAGLTSERHTWKMPGAD